MEFGTCANPSCEGGEGKFKCSACSTVAYCSPACQKSHWPAHKGDCKLARSGGKPKATAAAGDSAASENKYASSAKSAAMINAALNPHETAQRLQVLKLETQKLFTVGDFATAVKTGDTALAIARLLPEPAATMECIQIHLNMTSAHLQLKKMEEAQKHSKHGVELAERGMIMRPGDGHAIEMLAVALGSRTNVLLNEDMFDEAYKHGSRALSLAGKMYGPSDPRLFKYLRAVGLTQDKQEKLDESVTLLMRAFDLAFEHMGPLHSDCQSVTDELVNILFRKDGSVDKDKALELCKKSYEMGQRAILSGKIEKMDMAEGSLGDSAARYGTVLAKLEKEAEAEPVMRHAIKLREKSLGADHPTVGICLGYLAAILEGQGKVEEEAESCLVRAMEIFKKVEGPNGSHVQSTMVHLQRIRMKRSRMFYAPAGSTGGDDDDDEEEDTNVKVDTAKKVPAKPATPTSTVEAKKTSGTGSPSSAVTKVAKTKSGIPEVIFSADDGVGRMQHATQCFQMQEFSRAEILLAQAFDIFLRDNGPSHASTLAAKQNLEVVRANAINKLWQEVAKEEFQLLQSSMSDVGSSSAGEGTAQGSTKGDVAEASNKSTPLASPGVGVDSGNVAKEEVTWCQPQKISAEDEWLLRDTPKAGLSECVIA